MKHLNEKKAKRFVKKGQLMLEVLIVVAILSVVMVVATRRIAQSVRDASSSNDRIEAIRYAQDAAEWLKHWRDVEGFSGAVDGLSLVDVANISGGSQEYCWSDDSGGMTGGGVALPAIGNQTEFRSSCPSSNLIADYFQREVALELDNDGSDDFVEFEVTVSWFDSGRQQDVSVTGNIYDTD